MEELLPGGFAHGRDKAAQACQHSHEKQQLLRAKLTLGLGRDLGTGQASDGPSSRENTHFFIRVQSSLSPVPHCAGHLFPGHAQISSGS